MATGSSNRAGILSGPSLKPILLFYQKCSAVAAALCMKVISKLHKGCLLYEEWKRDNRPTFKPWLYPEQSCLPLLNTMDIVAMKYSTTCADLLGEANATEDQVADMVES